jgi:hypothetical protein
MIGILVSKQKAVVISGRLQLARVCYCRVAVSMEKEYLRENSQQRKKTFSY